MPARHSVSVARGAREASHTPAAAEPEDRQPLHRARKVEPVHQLGVEARDGEPSDGVDDESVDFLEGDAGIGDGGERHLSSKLSAWRWNTSVRASQPWRS